MKRIIYVLGLLFLNQNFAYAQEKDSIQIAQRKMIKGYVVDYDNTPLTDAIIKIKGTEYSVRSDAEGTFKLQNMNDFPVVLEVNKKGYQKSEVILDEYQPTITIKLNLIEKHIEAVLVTSRRRSEEIQKIPIPITVLTAKKIDDTGSFTVNRLKELVPTVQLYASNARNTTLNIRGLGSTFGLTNDGIDPGVGFYVDGVYYARPAATALDFIDTENYIEKLLQISNELSKSWCIRMSSLKSTYQTTSQAINIRGRSISQICLVTDLLDFCVRKNISLN